METTVSTVPMEAAPDNTGVHTSASIDKIAPALVAAQPMLKKVLKQNDNQYFKSKYADLSSVMEAAQDALKEHKLYVMQLPTDGRPTAVYIETRIYHESGQWIGGGFWMPIVKADPQAVGSAITYARRYALAAILGICPDDDDGNAAAGHSQPQAPPQNAPVASQDAPQSPRQGKATPDAPVAQQGDSRPSSGISEGQRKLLFARVMGALQEKGYTDNKIKTDIFQAYVHNVTGKYHTKDVTPTELKKLVDTADWKDVLGVVAQAFMDERAAKGDNTTPFD